MNTTTKNISLQDFRRYLKWKELKLIRTNGGHEIWSKANLCRPVVLPTHVDPVAEIIVRATFRTLGVEKEDYNVFLNRKK